MSTIINLIGGAHRAGAVVAVIATAAAIAATWRWSVDARDAAVPRIVQAACRDGDVRRLAELEARGVKLTGAWTVPPLAIAAKSGRLDVVRFLLSRGADVNQVGKFTTALELAVEGGHVEATRLLLDHGAR
ncbi:MAG TPA: ankyrin repeat domain-containing protein, partial [Anaeromyxobacteraceae bacterium]|nr:ankyrin repeat domain-containing protein [Anaeromyxobacteraceae bacterium]